MEDYTHTMRDDSLPSGRRPADGAPLTAWGPFELREKVGQGGFGAVYRAWDPKLQREVAVKLLLASRMSSPDADDSILREARLTAKVRHPNVVAVHGVDRHDGQVGFWTDFVRGKTLSKLLREQGPFAAREAALIGMELCRALGAVHAAGLLHRDIKPGNAMREEGGRILLMDFGLTQQGEEGGFGGTLPYMAPELFAGQPASVSSDIYGLGAMLFELVTGKCPAEPVGGAKNLREAYKPGARRSLFEERPDLPVQFARVVETAIDPDPKKRFASAGQFLSALSDAIGISSVTMPFEPSKPRPSRWWLAAAVPALLLAGYAIPGLRARFQRGFEKATGAHADYLKAQDLLEHYYQPHNPENAISLFLQDIEKEPKFALAWAGLGRAYWREYLDTRDVKYIPLAKHACSQALESGQDLASVHVTQGMIYTDGGQSDLATQELDLAQSIDENNPELYSARADLYRKQRRSKEIEPALQKAIDLDPRNWRWPNQLGLFYLSYSSPPRLDDAVIQFQKAIALAPDNAGPYNNLGVTYKNQERFADAIKAYRKAIQVQANFQAFSNLGAVLQLQGDYAGAAEMFRRSLDLNPKSYVAAGNLASALTWTPGKQEDARKAYMTAIELAEDFRKDRPKDTRVLADLGSFYASVNEPTKALPLLRQAVALDPDNSQVLYRAGEGYELMHRREEALKYVGKAIQAGYSLDYIRREPELAELRADPRFVGISGKK